METVGHWKIGLRNNVLEKVHFHQVVYFRYVFMYIVNRKRHLVLYLVLFLTAESFLKYFFSLQLMESVCLNAWLTETLNIVTWENSLC